MKQTTQLLTLAIMLCNGHSAFTMEHQQPNAHLLIIPGHDNEGGQNINTILPNFANNQHLTHRVKTSLTLPDLGQSKCQDCVKEEINALKSNGALNNESRLILYGSSHGTATAINYTANNPDNIKGLILEGTMLSGNSAMFHNIEQVTLRETLPICKTLPDKSYYAVAYIAKFLFPSYSPTGEQPVNNAYYLPTDLPIILLHDTQDCQSSFKDAQALYAFLTIIQKNQNVYLFTQESEHGKHINLLKAKHAKEIAALNAILKMHNLLPFDPHENLNITLDDLKEYQPKAQQEWLNHFHTIFNKETNLKIIDRGFKIGAVSVAAITAGLYALSTFLEM